MSVNSKILLNGMKKDLPPITIIEPFKPEVIECETKEDFIELINADKEKYEKMTTQKLNKIFSIPGYKVTKIKGEICLRSIKPCEQLEIKTNYDEELKNIKTAFNQLSEQFEYIKEMLGINKE